MYSDTPTIAKLLWIWILGAPVVYAFFDWMATGVAMRHTRMYPETRRTAEPPRRDDPVLAQRR